MHLILQRVSCGDNSTYGMLFIDYKHEGFTIEDIHRDVKVDGETRVPSGNYEVKFREVLSPMTKSYREKYDFFTWHLEIQDVPNFKYTYLHIGNTFENTEGCPLLNTGVTKRDGEYVGQSSVQAFKKIYPMISSVLEAGEKVTLVIRDEDNIHVPF